MCRILVADGDEAVGDVLRSALEEGGTWSVTYAADCDTAQRMLSAAPPHLAILDAAMRPRNAVKSGLALAACAVRLHVPVILMTGHPDLAEVLGKFQFPLLRKPFRIEQLRLQVQGATRQATSNRSSIGASLAELLARRDELGEGIARLETLSERIPAILAGYRRPQ